MVNVLCVAMYCVEVFFIGKQERYEILEWRERGENLSLQPLSSRKEELDD